MADATADPAPNAHPDAVVINEDGSVTTRGGRGFVWVTEAPSGARYDVPASMLPRAGLEPVPGYPVNYKPRARSAKRPRLLGDLTPVKDAPAPAPAAAGEDDPGVAAGDKPATSTKTEKGRSTK